jgi:dihydrofolate reductase
MAGDSAVVEFPQRRRLMRELNVVNFVTLDGVMQGPGSPDEDRTGGFEHGGWVAPYIDEDWGNFAAKGMAAGNALLFGRVTYEKMEAYWPTVSNDDPIAATMNNSTKYVVSNTLGEVTWQHTNLIKGDGAAEIAKLKETPGENITILGSGALIQDLMKRDLIDSYTLLLCPIILGTGKRLFRDGEPKTPLKLVESRTTSTGALIVVYQPERGR